MSFCVLKTGFQMIFHSLPRHRKGRTTGHKLKVVLTFLNIIVFEYNFLFHILDLSLSFIYEFWMKKGIWLVKEILADPEMKRTILMMTWISTKSGLELMKVNMFMVKMIKHNIHKCFRKTPNLEDKATNH